MYQSLEIETPHNGDKQRQHIPGKLLIFTFIFLFVAGAIIQSNLREADASNAPNLPTDKKHAIVINTTPRENTQPTQEEEQGTMIASDQKILTVTCGQTIDASIKARKKAFYRFKTPTSGSVIISTCNSNQRPSQQLDDSIVFVYAGTATSGDAITECDDCDPNGGGCFPLNQDTYNLFPNQPPIDQFSSPFQLTRNTQYTIGIGGYDNAAGNFRLQVTCLATNATTTAEPTSNPTTPRPTTRRPTFSPVVRGQCPPVRVRRDWHDLTPTEQDVYLDGYLELRRNGKLAIFTQEHLAAVDAGADNLTFHSGDLLVPAFIPWHRYFIWELEEQIRALGGRFSCFTLPYWDWSRAGDRGWLTSQIPMFNKNSSMGGDGNNVTGCVEDGKFTFVNASYQTTDGTCLARDFGTENPQYGNSFTIMEWIQNQGMNFTSFTDAVEGEHGNAHISVGGTLSDASTATDDPIFFLLHSYVDLLWAMRQDCQNNHHEYPNPGDVLSYPVLRNQSWAKVFEKSYVVRDVSNFSEWNFTYHASDIKARSESDFASCTWTEIIGIQAASNMYGKFSLDQSSGKSSHGKNRRRSKRQRSRDRRRRRRERKRERKVEKLCVRHQKAAIKKGLSRGLCKYDGPLEMCPGIGPLSISLDGLLNKRGVKGVKCLEDYRRRNYHFARQLRYLRGLCNGASDPVCWRY